MSEPYYRDDLVTLYHADNADVLPGISGVDLVFTSPPYNLGESPWPKLGNWQPGQGAAGHTKWRSKGASGLGDVWEVAQEQSPHPAPFPIGIPARAIETTAPGLVLDPFAGSGTTLRAAKDAGVKAIGIEKSERYCEMAAERLSQGAFDFGSLAEVGR